MTPSNPMPSGVDTIDPVYGFPLTLGTLKHIVLYIEVVRSNPNGDPGRAGIPRVDHDNRGVISNQSVKRMIRDYVHRRHDHSMFIEHGADLGDLMDRYKKGADRYKKGHPLDEDFDIETFLGDFWDAPVFGAHLTQSRVKVRGAFQFGDAVSVDPVEVIELPFTRVAGHRKVREVRSGDEVSTNEYLSTGFQSYSIVSYGLYRLEISYNPLDAAKNGLTKEAMALFWEGLVEGWQVNRSAHRVGVNLHSVYVFDYSNARGSEPTRTTAARVRAAVVGDVAPRSIDDYAFEVDDNLPRGITLTTWQDGRVEVRKPLAAK